MNWGKVIKKLKCRMMLNELELADNFPIAFISINKHKNVKSKLSLNITKIIIELFKEYNIEVE